MVFFSLPRRDRHYTSFRLWQRFQRPLLLIIHESSSAGLANLNTRAQMGTRKDFHGSRHSLLPQILFLLPSQCSYIVKATAHTHTHTLYMDYRCNQMILRGEHFYTNLERCEALTGYLPMGRRPGGDWPNT